jgi:hypothetical protein
LAIQIAGREVPLLPVLMHPQGKHYFRDYLKEYYCDHHLDFFESITSYSRYEPRSVTNPTDS